MSTKQGRRKGPKIYSIKVKKETDTGNIWFTVGHLTIFESSDSGSLTLNLFPNEKYYVYPKEESN